VDAGPQLAFCNATPAPPAFPPLGTVVKLRPLGEAGLSFRHCDAQGFVTPDDGEDHLFTLVAALDGAPGSISFRSVNFPAYFIAPVGVPEPSRLGIVQAPAAGDASWTLTPAPGDGGAYTLTLAAHGGLAAAVMSNLTGSCAGNYAPPSAGVSLARAATAWTVEPAAGPATCVISRIYDQSAYANHLLPAPPGGAAEHPDAPVDAMAFPVFVAGGARAFGARFEGLMGYRVDDTRGVATGNAPETIYSVVAGAVFNNGCCFDYGNAEANNHDDGAGTMEAVYFGTWNATRSGWCGGTGEGPWVFADLEDGLWACATPGVANPRSTPMHADFVTGMVRGGSTSWGIKAGDAAGGPLVTQYEGPRPPGYTMMKKQGAIILGIGGARPARVSARRGHELLCAPHC
jgi:hypothetical protein